MKSFKKLLIGVCVVGMALSSQMLYASVYEVRGQVNWQNQPCPGATVFLVGDREGGNSFIDEFHKLKQISSEINQLTDHEMLLNGKTELMRRFKRLIKEYRVREKSLSKDGSFYLNVSGATVSYLIVLKKDNQRKNNEEIVFWIERVDFDVADLSSKSFVLNEKNSTMW